MLAHRTASPERDATWRRRALTRSLTGRLLLSHLLVAVLTSVSLIALALVPAIIAEADTERGAIEEQRAVLVAWLTGGPAEPRAATPGAFTLVADATGAVRFARGEAPCRHGDLLAACAPALARLPAGTRVAGDAGQFIELALPLADGGRLVARTRPRTVWDLTLNLGAVQAVGTVSVMTTFLLVTAGLAAPPALVFAWLLAGPLVQRLRAVARTSRRFAAGDFAARANDPTPDEVGDLARQFDEMAGVLATTIDALRDLARENAELARQVEAGAREAERLRLARDLHDDIAQQLFSLSLGAAALDAQVGREQPALRPQTAALAAQAERALLDLRRVLVDLRPAALAERGLAAALEDGCRAWGQAHGVAVECAVVLGAQVVPQSVAEVAYRVAQEALANIARHAGARHVSVALIAGPACLTLSITDDGRGFAAAVPVATGRYGIVGMRERARAVGGTLDIESEPGAGATLRLRVPLGGEEGI